MLSKQDQRNLDKINRILKESYDFTTEISAELSADAVRELRKQAQGNMNTIMESSEFNTYHRNKEYNKCLLVVEATNILLNKKTTQNDLDEIVRRAYNESKVVTVSDKYHELKAMYERYVAKNGMTPVAEGMKAKLDEVEKQMYNENVRSKLSLLLKEDADKAEAIMAAKGLLDDLLGYQSKIGETQNKYLDPFIAMVRSEYSTELADEIYNKMNDALTELLGKVRETKEVFANVVAVLSGQGELEDSMVEPEEEEDMEKVDVNVEDDDQEDEQETPEFTLGDEEEVEDSDDHVSENDEDEAVEEFKRREE